MSQINQILIKDLQPSNEIRSVRQSNRQFEQNQILALKLQNIIGIEFCFQRRVADKAVQKGKPGFHWLS